MNEPKSGESTLYPNPPFGQVVIDYDDYYSSWSLYSRNGKIIAKGLLNSYGQTKIDLGDNTGLMFLVLE